MWIWAGFRLRLDFGLDSGLAGFRLWLDSVWIRLDFVLISTGFHLLGFGLDLIWIRLDSGWIWLDSVLISV